MTVENEKLYASIGPNARGEVIRVKGLTSGGKRIVDTRFYYSTGKMDADGKPEYAPTKKGLWLDLETFEEVLAAMNKAAKDEYGTE
jgi:hypothetical protein